MPRKDGTGPEGKGPQTGRGMGPCNKDSKNKGQASTNQAGFGMGRGAGRGQGRGAGRGFAGK